MGQIKMRKWEITLIRMLGIPILKKVITALEEQAKKTPNCIDDAIVGTFKVALSWLEDPETIEET